MANPEPFAVAHFAVILPAAGKSSRFRDPHYKKPFAPLDGRSVWLLAADRFLQRSDVKQTIVIVSSEDWEEFHEKFGANLAVLGIEVVAGGNERADSIQNALARVRADIDYVAIHDAARPCVIEAWIDKVFAAAQKTGAAILAIPQTSTLKRSKDGRSIDETVSREQLWQAQTPQVFERKLLLDAYAKRGDFVATDDAQLVERIGQKVSIVEGSAMNIKITTKDDLKLAGAILKVLPKPTSLGALPPLGDGDFWK